MKFKSVTIILNFHQLLVFIKVFLKLIFFVSNIAVWNFASKSCFLQSNEIQITL